MSVDCRTRESSRTHCATKANDPRPITSTPPGRTGPRTLAARVTGVLLLVAACVAGPALAWDAFPVRQPGGANPALVTDNSRDPDYYNDFMRITFVPSSVEVSTPSRKTALRAFFGSARFYDPPLPVDVIAEFNGFAPTEANDLIAMACRPRTPTADARYATWPNLARMIVADLGSKGYACPPPAGADNSNVAYCVAADFRDTPSRWAAEALLAALQFGQKIIAIDGGNWIYQNYGAGYNYSGLGMVVRGPAVPLTSAEALEQMVVPEYLLKNVNLASANCRCIRVPPYPGRDQDLLPPGLVWDQGDLDADGKCVRIVNRLPHARR